MPATTPAPAIKLRGMACVGLVKINSYKDRAKGCKDASITIDENHWLDANARKREALLYHEIRHLELCYTKETEAKPRQLKRDRLGRPKLRMRLHDVEVGLFKIVVEEYGEDSFDHDQLEGISRYVQKLFAWG